MSEPFVAEIRMFAGNFAPRGWMFCEGQLLQISQNDMLFSLLGTVYGGDGQTTFGLPDLRGRSPVHRGSSISLGQMGGEESHSVNQAEMPSHDHVAQASSNAASGAVPTGNVVADSAPNQIYRLPAEVRDLRAGTVGNAGGGQSHENMQPFLVLNFIIALQGLFPSRN